MNNVQRRYCDRRVKKRFASRREMMKASTREHEVWQNVTGPMMTFVDLFRGSKIVSRYGCAPGEGRSAFHGEGLFADGIYAESSQHGRTDGMKM